MSKEPHRETPYRRINPSGEVVWVARYTDRNGKRRYARPDWNHGKSTFKLKRDAQRAIDEAYELPETKETLGEYFTTWPAEHPRSERTNYTNKHRITQVLDVKVEGQPLRDWQYRKLRRRHALALVRHLLVTRGRSRQTTIGIIRSLSAMTEDAITDEVADLNAFKGVKIRKNDPRIRSARRPVRVFSFEDMHRFAAAADQLVTKKHKRPRPPYQPLVRTFTDTAMRIGEVLPLERTDFTRLSKLTTLPKDVPDCDVFIVRRTAHNGKIFAGTKTDHGEDSPGRIVPCPPTLARMIRAMPTRIDTPLLFPTPAGKLWHESNFYRDVWLPTQEVAGLDIRPHECRHSFISHLRKHIDDADLADIAGHTVETMLSYYTHPLRESFEQVRRAIG